VIADAEASGCGAPGAQVLLWTFAQDEKLYSREAVGWPRDGHATVFDASFSTSTPAGGAPPTSEMAGEVFRRDGRLLPPGTRVEAYVGATRCAVASSRRAGNFSGYILAVVGPDSIPGCIRGATLTFRIDGRPAVETSTNDPGHGSSFDLTPR
jgi:hypothetical protein